jgi:hypothetical protein
MISIRKTAFFLWIIPCNYVDYEFVVFISCMRSPEMLICVPFCSGASIQDTNVDEHETRSTHHAEYCDNFLQKFQSLMQFGPQYSFCHFYLLHTFDICFIVDAAGQSLCRTLSTLLRPSWKCLGLSYT